MAGEGAERGSAGLSCSTRRGVAWPNRMSDLRLRHVSCTHLGMLAEHVTQWQAQLAIELENTVSCLRHCQGFDNQLVLRLRHCHSDFRLPQIPHQAHREHSRQRRLHQVCHRSWQRRSLYLFCAFSSRYALTYSVPSSSVITG
jgi:hypothetical protein